MNAVLQAEAALSGLNAQVLDHGSRPLNVVRARPRTMTPGASGQAPYGSPQTHYPRVCLLALQG